MPPSVSIAVQGPAQWRQSQDTYLDGFERRILRPPHRLVYLLDQIVQRPLGQVLVSAACATAIATAADTVRRLVIGGSRLAPRLSRPTGRTPPPLRR
jgi:hypothetical protein